MLTRKPACFLLLVASLLPLLGGVRIARASSNCSLATLKGTYAGVEQGTFVAQLPGFPPPPVLFVGATVHTYDGAGNLSGKATVSIGGAIVPSTFTGTYTVNPDCTYSEEITVASGPVLSDFGAITGEGIFRETHYVWSVPGTVVVGTLEKTPPEVCSQGTLKGRYALLGQGAINAPIPGLPPPPIPVGLATVLTADGEGNISGGGTRSVGGAILPFTFTGTYTVDADCGLSFVVTVDSGEVLHRVGAITTSGGEFQEFHSIVTDPGFVLADTAKRQ